MYSNCFGYLCIYIYDDRMLWEKEFFEYLFDFSDHEVCLQENKPEPIKSIPEAEPMKLLPVLEKKRFSHC